MFARRRHRARAIIRAVGASWALVAASAPVRGVRGGTSWPYPIPPGCADAESERSGFTRRDRSLTMPRSIRSSVPLMSMVVLAAALVGCGGEASPETGSTASRTDAATSSVAPSLTATDTPGPTNGDAPTLRTLIDDSPERPVLTIGAVLAETPTGSASAVSYQSGGFTVTGVLRVPAGPGRDATWNDN